MTKSFRHIVNILGCVLLLLFVTACREQAVVKELSERVKDAVASSQLINDSLGGQFRLHFLDSSVGGLYLSPADRYAVYAEKYDIYRGPLHNNRRAVAYADSMLIVMDQNKFLQDSVKIFRALMLKANAAYAGEQYDLAFRTYDLAKEHALRTAEPCEEFIYLYRIAMAHFREENFIESARLFRLAFDKSLKCTTTNHEHRYRQQELLSNTGIAYSKVKKFDSGRYFCMAALAFIDKAAPSYPEAESHWQEARSVVMGNLGDMFRQLNKFDSAEYYFRESIILNKKSNRNFIDRQFNLLKLADLYIDLNKSAQARNVLEEYEVLNTLKRKVYSDKDQLEFDLRSTDVYSKYYYLAGNYKSSVSYVKRHDSLRERKLKQTNRVLLNSLVNGIDNIGHERQILSLQKDVQIRKQQNIILYLTSLLAVVAILIVFVNLRKGRLEYSKLKKTHEEITKEGEIRHALLQRKVRRDEVNFMALIENTDDFLWSIDKDYNLLAFNRSYKEYFHGLFGKYPEIGKPEIVKEFSPKDYAKLVEGYKAILSGQPYEIIDKGVPFNGAVPDIEVRFKPIKDELGIIVGVSCFRRDITQTVRLIRTLERNNIQLRDIAWVQSHKLRGPLSTIMSAAAYLADEEIGDELRAEILSGLREKIDEMDAIIHEIVDLTN
jgi:PAS domain S-box-containing protein